MLCSLSLVTLPPVLFCSAGLLMVCTPSSSLYAPHLMQWNTRSNSFVVGLALGYYVTGAQQEPTAQVSGVGAEGKQGNYGTMKPSVRKQTL